MSKFEVGEYLQKNGCKAWVYRTDGHGSYPLIGAADTHTGNIVPRTWTADGVYNSLHHGPHLDLVPPQAEIWINVYPRALADKHSSRAAADVRAGPDRIARIRAVEGQFDE